MLFLVKDLWCLATEWDGRRQKNKYTEYQISRQLSGYWDQPSNLSAQGSNFRASWKADWLLFILVGQGSAVSDPHGQEHVAKGPSRVSCPAETRRVRIESGGLQTCFFWGIFSLTMEVGHRGQVSTDLFSLIEPPPQTCFPLVLRLCQPFQYFTFYLTHLQTFSFTMLLEVYNAQAQMCERVRIWRLLFCAHQCKINLLFLEILHVPFDSSLIKLDLISQDHWPKDDKVSWNSIHLISSDNALEIIE